MQFNVNRHLNSDPRKSHIQWTFGVIKYKERGQLPKFIELRMSSLILTHLPLVSRIWVSESGQHWFRKWLVAYSAPRHYLNQCWVIVNWTLRNKRQWNFNQNEKKFIHENAPENIVCEMAAILSRERWHCRPNSHLPCRSWRGQGWSAIRNGIWIRCDKAVRDDRKLLKHFLYWGKDGQDGSRSKRNHSD